MQNALVIPYRDSENLNRVVGRLWHDEASLDKPLLVAVVLGFDRTDVSIAVGADDEVTVTSPVSADGQVIQEINLCDVAPWKEAIGKPLLWSWTMINQQGYSDGLQLEFAKNVEAESVIVQVMALAGGLRVRAITPKLLP